MDTAGKRGDAAGRINLEGEEGLVDLSALDARALLVLRRVAPLFRRTNTSTFGEIFFYYTNIHNIHIYT